MIKWLEENLYNILVTILGGGSLFGFLFERNKRRIQEKQEEASALETIQNVYDKFVKDSQDRYTDLLKQITDIKKELENVSNELEIVTKELNEEKRKSGLLKASYDALKKTCEELNKQKKI